MDTSKLPKWAQEKLHKLQRDVDTLREANTELQKQLRLYEDKAEFPHLIVEPYRSTIGSTSRGQVFPIQQTIRVQLGKPWSHAVDINATSRGVEVSSARGTLSIIPVASNTVRIEGERL